MISRIAVAKLKKLDDPYFRLHYEDWKTNKTYIRNIPNTDLAYMLATFLFDHDADWDEETWDLLDKIRKLFGQPMVNAVIKNLCYRNHDT